MTRTGFLSAILTFVLILRTVSASFGLCIGLKGPSFFGREVVGFKLWSDQGDDADQYRTILWAGKTSMQNNGWHIDLKFINQDGLRLSYHNTSIFVWRDDEVIAYDVTYQSLCSSKENRFYYGCSNGVDAISDYCNSHRQEQIQFCTTQLNMGSDFMPCGETS